MDTYHLSKTINAPIKYVFDWCTDFREDDSSITSSKAQTKILEKTKKRAIYVSNYVGEDGKPKIGVNIVSMKSPNYWHLEFLGEEDDEIGEYSLKSLGKNKTQLDMTFKEKWKITTGIPTKEEMIESSGKSWDKFVAALEKDYNSKAR